MCRPARHGAASRPSAKHSASGGAGGRARACSASRLTRKCRPRACRNRRCPGSSSVPRSRAAPTGARRPRRRRTPPRRPSAPSVAGTASPPPPAPLRERLTAACATCPCPGPDSRRRKGSPLAISSKSTAPRRGARTPAPLGHRAALLDVRPRLPRPAADPPRRQRDHRHAGEQRVHARGARPDHHRPAVRQVLGERPSGVPLFGCGRTRTGRLVKLAQLLHHRARPSPAASRSPSTRSAVRADQHVLAGGAPGLELEAERVPALGAARLPLPLPLWPWRASA
jgi:hypothetical protein